MQADFTVEIGADFPSLEFPWEDDGGARFYDLVAQPELLLYVEEANRYREMGEFLAALNSAHSAFHTVKCDAWRSTEISEEEEIFGAAEKFCSYVDLVFREEGGRGSLPAHEEFARTIVKLLQRAPEISAAAEFVVRRCYYRVDAGRPGEHQEGFSVTFYLFGYGEDEADARRRWMIGMKVVENALLQLSAKLRGVKRAEERGAEETEPG